MAAWTLLAALAAGAAAPPAALSQTVPPFVERGQRGPGHAAMDPLVGDWSVRMELYIAGGTREAPLIAELRTRRELIGQGRFLQDLTTGDMPGGGRYWRVGTLGYSAIDGAYEWVTQDGVNANMMIYRGAPRSGPGFPADLVGSFTDQGVLGERYVGQTIGQRTRIEIESADRHRLDLYFTPPGEAERLVGRMDYTRARN